MTSVVLVTTNSTDELRRLKLEKLRRLTQSKHSGELRQCSEDVVYWLEKYGVTYDPRLDGNKFVPFKPWPKQIELLRWIESRESGKENGLIEKSRDSGASYLCCAFALHRWLFVPGYSVGFGSRKEDFVDKIGDPDSLFEKIRILFQSLPDWMKPNGFSEKRHSAHMKLVNPANGATITGEAGDNIGRGGRKSIYFVDESAFIERPELIDRSLSATTNVRIDVSTPNGQGNPFYQKRFGGRVEVFTFHWKDDPRKNRTEVDGGGNVVYPWYEEYKASHDSVTVAQEIDIDYAASIEGVCIPAKWIRAAVEYPIAGVSKDYPLVAGFDVADGGKAESVMVPRRGPFVMDPTAWGEMSAGQAAHRAAEAAESMGIQEVYYDAIGVGASVKEAWDYSERKLGFKPIAIKWGDAPSGKVWRSGKSSVEIFVNLRAELWWTVRTRFEKTWQVINEGAAFPPDELISIPNDPTLIAQLSSVLYHYTNTGKIQIESKADMAKRGVASPDRADALCYSESPRFELTYAEGFL